MKSLKQIIFAICLTTVVSGSYAQIYRVKIGTNLSNIKFANDYRSDAVLGYSLGATAEFPVHKLFSLETGLLISTKGATYTMYGSGVDSKANFKDNLTYLDMPVNAKISFKIVGIKTYGLIGPYFGYGLRSKEYINGQVIKTKWGNVDEYGYYKRMECGMNMGVGFELTKAFQIGLTYNLGLTNINAYKGVYDEYNRVLSLTLGYAFATK